jgi:hypothetical protein
LLLELPNTGKAIAIQHCEALDKSYPGHEYDEAMSLIRRLTNDPYDILAHEPKWHQWSIPEHSTNVVRVAFHFLVDDLLNQSEAVQKSVKHLQSKMIDGVSLLDLFLISIPLHDIGKYQPIIKPADEKKTIRSGHTGHEARSGDIIRKLSNHDCPEELHGLRNIFNESQINANHLAFIEQCARLHYELGKIREDAKNSPDGYNINFVSSEEFEYACKVITKEHRLDLNIIKGLYFLVDNAGKVDMDVCTAYQKTTELDPKNAKNMLPQLMDLRKIPTILERAIEQYPVNRAVALNYLNQLFN